MKTNWHIHKREELVNLSYQICVMDCSANDRHIALTQGNKICVFNPKLRKQRVSIQYRHKVANSIRFSPDSNIFIQGIYQVQDRSNKLILIWDVRTRKQIGKLLTDKFGGRNLEFSNDGQSIITQSYSTVITAWNWIQRQFIYVATELSMKVELIVYNPLNYNEVAINSGRDLQIVNLESKQIIKNLRCFFTNQMKYSFTGRLLAASGSSLTTILGIRFWKASGNNSICSNMMLQKQDVTIFHFFPNSALLALATRNRAKSSISVMSVKTRKLVRIFAQSLNNYVRHLCISSDGQYLISISNQLVITPFII